MLSCTSVALKTSGSVDTQKNSSNTLGKVCIVAALLYAIIATTLNMYGIIQSIEKEMLLFAAGFLFIFGFISEVKHLCTLQKQISKDKRNLNNTLPITGNSPDKTASFVQPICLQITKAFNEKDDSHLVTLLPTNRTANAEECSLWTRILQTAFSEKRSELTKAIIKAEIIDDPVILRDCLKDALQLEQFTIAKLIIDGSIFVTIDDTLDLPKKTYHSEVWFEVLQSAIKKNMYFLTIAIVNSGLLKDCYGRALKYVGYNNHPELFLLLIEQPGRVKDAYNIIRSANINEEVWEKVLIRTLNKPNFFIAILQQKKITNLDGLLRVFQVLIANKHFGPARTIMRYAPAEFRTHLTISTFPSDSQENWEGILASSLKYGYYPYAITLLNNGVIQNEKVLAGSCILHHFINHSSDKSLNYVSEFIKWGPSLNEQDKNGNTVYHLAAKKLNWKLLALLISKNYLPKYDRSIKNHEGQCAINILMNELPLLLTMVKNISITIDGTIVKFSQTDIFNRLMPTTIVYYAEAL